MNFKTLWLFGAVFRKNLSFLILYLQSSSSNFDFFKYGLPLETFNWSRIITKLDLIWFEPIKEHHLHWASEMPDHILENKFTSIMSWRLPKYRFTVLWVGKCVRPANDEWWIQRKLDDNYMDRYSLYLNFLGITWGRRATPIFKVWKIHFFV